MWTLTIFPSIAVSPAMSDLCRQNIPVPSTWWCNIDPAILWSSPNCFCRESKTSEFYVRQLKINRTVFENNIRVYNKIKIWYFIVDWFLFNTGLVFIIVIINFIENLLYDILINIMIIIIIIIILLNLILPFKNIIHSMYRFVL